MLLYIHVPFCRRKCHYCSFYSECVKGHESGLLTADYARTVWNEIAYWSERLNLPNIESVFFGGGTPSLLSPDIVAKMIERVRRFFMVAPGAEISFEANPESIGAVGQLESLRQAGVTRLSIGVQSFDDRDLTVLGRLHSARQAREVFLAARRAGFDSINIDLMWGLPGQTVKSWLKVLDQACVLSPDHISAYCLTLDPGLPLTREVESGALSLPDDDVLSEMFVKTREKLANSGYDGYEIANFARPGHRCRHNIGYWRGEDYLGLGPGATSTINSLRWTNPPSLDIWQRNVNERVLPEAETLCAETRSKERLMLGLRMSEGLDLSAWLKEWPGEEPASLLALLPLLEEQGLVLRSRERISLTVKGMLVSNLILERLFDCLKKDGEIAQNPAHK